MKTVDEFLRQRNRIRVAMRCRSIPEQREERSGCGSLGLTHVEAADQLQP
jgi:hypothetical protein